MYSYIKGFVKEIESNYIVLDNNGIGYLIYTSNPYSFNIDEEYTVYIYQNVKEDELTLYGFKLKEEKDLFLKLIEVKGLGCKMALPIIATGSISGIIDAIERENILYLKKFPKIGDKVAKQIILDLKGFNEQEKVIKSNIILYTITRLFNTTKGIEKIHIEDIIKLCANNIGNKFLTPNKNLKVFIKNGKIKISKEV